MTKGMRDFFDLPDLTDAPPIPEPEAVEDTALETVEGNEPDANLAETSKALDKASEHLAVLDGRDHAQKMDTLYQETLEHGRNLIDYGYNADQARARGLFEVAGQFYKAAIDAANSKRDAQLKVMKLMQDQKKLELEEKRINFEMGISEEKTITTDAVIIEDRNELLRRLRQKKD